MADFDIAYRLTMKHEGGYANNPHDRGRETYKGIARKFWSGWIGWPLIDDAKKQPGFPRSLDENMLLQAHVKAFYRNCFWPAFMADMSNQDLANWLFDKGVNMGIPQAVKLLQRAIGAADDGKYGAKTDAALKKALAEDAAGVLERCREHARAFYRQLAAKDPSQAQFLNGWLKRA